MGWFFASPMAGFAPLLTVQPLLVLDASVKDFETAFSTLSSTRAHMLVVTNNPLLLAHSNEVAK